MTVPAYKPDAVDVTVLAPAHDEEDNVESLVREIEAALTGTDRSFEIVIVDDGSVDQTRSVLRSLQAEVPQLRVLAMTNTPPGRGNGQSAAMAAGIQAARGDLIAMLDADLQNDPADLPALLERFDAGDVDVVQGDRSHARRDTFVRRISSLVGRMTRRILLGDSIRDTGCSLRVLVERLDRILTTELLEGSFITMLFGIIEPDGTFTYANAGHGPAVAAVGGTIRHLEAHRPPLGVRIDDDDEPGETTIQLGPGDRLILATDGVPEALDDAGRHLGVGPIERAATDGSLDGSAIVVQLRKAVHEHCGGPSTTDDVTMLCVQRVS